MQYKIDIKIKDHPYQIIIEEGISKKTAFYIRKLNIGNFFFVVTTKKIYSLYNKYPKKIFSSFPYSIFYIPEGEKAKSKKYLFGILQSMIKESKPGRKLVVCSWGGGVVGDITGLAASLYKRGTPFIQIPTTLLSQVDASIGGKTAIDFGGIKNIIGTFYHPKIVLIDPIFLLTLPKKEIKQGIAEMIKYGVIKNKELFYSLKRNHYRLINLDIDYLVKVIYPCAKIKAKIVEKDEKEDKGLRTILNFGHTFAHALEATLGFKRRIPHGAAVAWGMIQAAKVSRLMGLCSSKEVKEIEEIINIYRLIKPATFNINSFLRYFMYDKKFKEGCIRLVLIDKIGNALVKDNVPLKIVKQSLQGIHI